MERADDARKDKLGESIYIGNRIAFDREKFDHMNERIYMCDPETYDLIYINQAIYRDFHLPDDFSCAGKKCYEVIAGGKEPCEFCTNHLLRRDSFYTWTYHNAISGFDYLLRDTLVPWRGKNYRFSMSINLNEYVNRDIRGNELLYREASINDALSIAMREEDSSQGIQKMLWKIGSELDADRISIFGARCQPHLNLRVRCGQAFYRQHVRMVPQWRRADEGEDAAGAVRAVLSLRDVPCAARREDR